MPKYTNTWMQNPMANTRYTSMKKKRSRLLAWNNRARSEYYVSGITAGLTVKNRPYKNRIKEEPEKKAIERASLRFI